MASTSGSVSASGSINSPTLLAAGKQGCVYNGEFDKIKKMTNANGCDTIQGSTRQPQMITKIMADKAGYDKEIAAARVLAQRDPAMQVAVYATRGCTIQIQDVLNAAYLEECNRKKLEKNILKETGYSIEMPYVRHQTLRKMTPGSVHYTTGIRLFKELEDNIGKLQSWGIYHKDLHDKNVLIVGDREDQYAIRIADFGCAEVVQPMDKAFMGEDIATAIPSFIKLYTMIRDRPREIKPESIGNYIKQNGRLYGWARLENEIKSYKKEPEDEEEPLDALELPGPSGKRLRFGSPPAPGSAAKRPTARSLFDGSP